MDPAIRRNRLIEQELLKAMQHDVQVVKLLLLGPGESGKSTLFKQAKTLYGQSYSKHERQSFIPTIYDNIFKTIRKLIEHALEYGGLQEKTQTSAKILLSLEDNKHV